MKTVLNRVIMLVSFFSLFICFQSFAELKQYGDFQYSVENYAKKGEDDRFGACIYYYTATNSNAVLTFPDEIEGYPVLEITRGTKKNTIFFLNRKVKDSVVEAIIPESVEKVGRVFENCKSLETVTFDGTNVKKIDSFAFQYCEKLKNIELPDGVKEIGNDAFWMCNSLEEFTIPSTVERFGSNRSGTEYRIVIGGRSLSKIINLSDNKFPIRTISNSYYWYHDENGKERVTEFIPANSIIYKVRKDGQHESRNNSSDDSDNSGDPVTRRKLEDLKQYPGLNTLDLPVTEGSWEVKDGRWTFKRSDGQYAKSQWVYDGQKWYIVGSDGWMLTGWQQINGKWYYFDSDGHMWANCYSPDGYFVSENGEWIA